jgi:hypothetical protein
MSEKITEFTTFGLARTTYDRSIAVSLGNLFHVIAGSIGTKGKAIPVTGSQRRLFEQGKAG